MFSNVDILYDFTVSKCFTHKNSITLPSYISKKQKTKHDTKKTSLTNSYPNLILKNSFDISHLHPLFGDYSEVCKHVWINFLLPTYNGKTNSEKLPFTPYTTPTILPETTQSFEEVLH